MAITEGTQVEIRKPHLERYPWAVGAVGVVVTATEHKEYRRNRVNPRGNKTIREYTWCKVEWTKADGSKYTNFLNINQLKEWRG